MSNYSLYLKPCKTLTVEGNVITAEEIEVPDVEKIIVDGSFVRFQRFAHDNLGFTAGLQDIVVYHRDMIIGWQIIGSSN